MKRIISITFIIVILALMPEIAHAAVSKIGADMRITNSPSESNAPSLVWTGTGYGVSWYDLRDGNPEIYFARLDSSGNKIGSDVRITNNTSLSYNPSLLWTGTEYGMSWYDNRDGNWEVYFARFDSSGAKIGSDVRITNASSESSCPFLVWTGTEYGVSWMDFRDGSNDETYFARIDSTGAKIGADVRITNNPSWSQYPSLVRAGTEYGVSWMDNRDGNYEIYFARINSSGAKIGSDVRITNDPSDSYSPWLVWTGTEYGVSWRDNRDGNMEIYFARIDSSGAKIGSEVRITNDPSASDSPSLVWTGTGYGVSWWDNRDGNSEIYFARINSSGAKIGSDVRITNDPAESLNASLVWTGTEYGVSWRDNRDGNAEIYFARIGDSAPIGNIYPPTPTQHFYGDADGDTAITVTDLNIIVNYINAQPYTFYTLQANTPDADWNTCDVDSDQVLTVTDKNILLNYINAQPVSIPDKPWTLQGVNIPAGNNYTGVWFPFNASLSSLDGTSGRPGISVVATIKPVGQWSTTTGSLHGRTCSPTAGPPRDQPADIGAQCALAVTITDWMASATDGLTEPYDPPNGHLGFEIQGDTPGIIMINLRVEDAYLDIPALSINVPVFFITSPIIKW